MSKGFENRIERMSKNQLIFLAGAYEGLARRTHSRAGFDIYFDKILKRAEKI